MKIRPSSFFLIFVVLAFATFIGVSAMMPYWEAKLLPLIVGGITFCLAVLELWKEIRTRDRQPEVPEGGPGDVGSVSRGLWVAVAWIGGATLGVYLFGFLVGIALFVFSFLKWRGRSWGVAMAVALITIALIYGIFEFVLGSELYRGYLYEKMTG